MWRLAHRKVQLPAGTDPIQTYQYRWISDFAGRLDEWQIHDEWLVREMIRAIVNYARERNLLRMGASILAMQKVLEVCYNTITAERRDAAAFALDLNRCKSFMADACGWPPDVQRLVAIPRPGGFVNLVHWLRSQAISYNFASLSKSCYGALAIVAVQHPRQRAEICSVMALHRRRIGILAKPGLAAVARRILGSDLCA
jgi:hypothetical protein